MDETEFLNHLTDVTQDLKLAYQQDLTTELTPHQALVSRGQIVRQLMIQLNQVDQTARSDQDLFVVDSVDELQQLCAQTFDHQKIFCIDNVMTRAITQYFINLGLDFHRQFKHAVYVHTAGSKTSNLYFVHDIEHDLKGDLNECVFGGRYQRTNSIDRFLKTVA